MSIPTIGVLLVEISKTMLTVAGHVQQLTHWSLLTTHSPGKLMGARSPRTAERLDQVASFPAGHTASASHLVQPTPELNLNVRSKLISAAVVVPVVMAAPAVASDTPHPTPDPVITDPAEPTPEPTPTIEEPTQTPSPVPEQPAPVDTIPAPTPTTSYSTVPISNPVPSPATKRARAIAHVPRRGEHAQRPLQPDGSGVPAHEVGPCGRSGYRNGCLRLADDAYAPRGGRTGTALRQWYRAKRNGFGHRNRYAPIGAQLFWRTSNPAGHVATYVGRGLVVTNVGSGRVKIMSWRALDRWGRISVGPNPSTSRRTTCCVSWSVWALSTP